MVKSSTSADTAQRPGRRPRIWLSISGFIPAKNRTNVIFVTKNLQMFPSLKNTNENMRILRLTHVISAAKVSNCSRIWRSTKNVITALHCLYLAQCAVKFSTMSCYCRRTSTSTPAPPSSPSPASTAINSSNDHTTCGSMSECTPKSSPTLVQNAARASQILAPLGGTRKYI